MTMFSLENLEFPEDPVARMVFYGLSSKVQKIFIAENKEFDSLPREEFKVISE